MTEGRFELKYAIPAQSRETLLDLIGEHISPDPHGKPLNELASTLQSKHTPLGYAVHSLYFDEPNLEGYGRRLAEARIRNRVRIRTYGQAGENQPMWLEAKRKLGQRVIKHRIRVGDWNSWSQSDPDAPWEQAVERAGQDQQRAAQRWVDVVKNREMRPVCAVHYLRECYAAGRDRLTIDHRVRGSVATSNTDYRQTGTVELIPRDWLVLELKFDDQQPLWMRRLCQTLRLAEEPISKFALGVVHTQRAEREAELRYLTPVSILRAER